MPQPVTTIVPLALCLLVTACSRERLERVVARSPELPSRPAAGFGVSLPPVDSPGLSARQRDVVYLAHLLAAYYPDRDQLDTLTLTLRTRQLLARLPGLPQTDFAWRAALQRFLAQLQDGHSYVDVPLYRAGEPYYSLSLLPSPDGQTLRVLALDSMVADTSLRGAEVISVNGHSVADVFARVRSFHPGENRYYKDHFLRRREPLPKYWRALGVSDSDTLTLRLSAEADTSATVRLVPHENWRAWSTGADSLRFPFARENRRGFFRQYLPERGVGYLQMNTSLDWAAMRTEVGNYVPFPLTPLAKGVLRRQHKRRATLDFGRVVAEFFRRAAADSLARVILDLRYNPGGDERLGLQFIYYLAEAHRRDSLLAPQTYYRFDGLLRDAVPGDYHRYRRAFAKTRGRDPRPEEWVALDREVLRRGFWQGIDAPESPLYVDPTVPKFAGEVYVLTGPRTFSAASILAATLQDNGLATLVGEPTGNRPSGPTGASRIELPHTRTVIALSYVRFDRADATLNEMDAVYPDVPAPVTYESLMRGGDPALEAALDL